MNTFMNELKKIENMGYTENGAAAYKSTRSKVLDLFALGGAYRNKSDSDIIKLFKEAFEENPLLAMKCLFYLRDVRGGQGERRFFRVAFKWLCIRYPKVAESNLENIPFFGRWDDIYCAMDTAVEKSAFDLIEDQLAMDIGTIINENINWDKVVVYDGGFWS